LQKQLALSLMRQPSRLASIYFARVLSDNRIDLIRNKMYIDSFFLRCLKYDNLINLISLKIIALILLNDKLISRFSFGFAESVVFKLMRRKIPKKINIDGDRV